ncbi:hypothetical protein KFL_000970380 [Klebsormidium nitens]|uniref:Metallo-beta-lactamase domain-containing protein n=1 Tax=Klebsormidium nitens TaxID=105231 RepID=A0A0U9HUM9_KLENI|nr:hypothetical protein KFL_000970380 [Klebsormidium nitens]|eukprot:GAQ82012.1 hypothetical protein KFL_000970380 [Klebsormidium nitens]
MAASDYTALTPVLADALPDSGPAELQCFVCETCNVQYAPSATPPPGNCPVCADERQYVPQSGQRWTTLAKLGSGHRNAFQRMEPQLLGIGTEPKSGIGQRALLVSTKEGNLLWDCIALLDGATRDIVTALGGIKAIAISHPHYYSTCVEWSRAFSAPIYIHTKERAWVEAVRPDAIAEHFHFWEGDQQPLFGGLSLWHLGGHFAGAQICHWQAGAGGEGALLVGDIIQINPGCETVGVMRSYPCLIPLSDATVARIQTRMARLPPYRTVYGAFWYQVMKDAGGKIEYSLERYRKWLSIDDPEIA